MRMEVNRPPLGGPCGERSSPRTPTVYGVTAKSASSRRPVADGSDGLSLRDIPCHPLGGRDAILRVRITWAIRVRTR